MRIFHLALISITMSLMASSTLALDAGDLAIVQDSDGFTNIRKGASTKSKIIGKVDDGGFVWIYTPEGKDWFEVAFFDAKGKEQSGFIHSSRVVSLENFTSVERKVSKNIDVVVYSKEELRVRFAAEEFEKEAAKITYTKTEDGTRFPSRIDGYEIWGTDGNLPKKQYEEIEITQGAKTYVLPKEAIGGLYEPNLSEDTKVFYDPKRRSIYITAFNSDGAGGYVVGIRIVNGKYKDRFVISPF